jgi:betaine-aldehyde dehydrogenase
MATDTKTLRVIEPATEKVMAELHEATVEEADAAVARAKAAYPAWKAVSPKDRANLLRRIGATVEKHLEELAQLEARNVGKPISDARGEVGMVVDVFNYYAGAPERLAGKTIPVAGGVDMTFREPLGVVALIVPWNFPLPIAAWKVAPALAAGNTIVLKPAGLTPLTAVELGRIALEAGLPEGVLNILVGAGRVVGERLVQHPDVAKVAFTGSTEVGKRIGALAAQSIKRVSEHGLRRRRSRKGRRDGAARSVRQRGPGLLCPVADPRRAIGARPLHAGDGEIDQIAQGR